MYNGAGKEERDMGDVTKAAVDDADDAKVNLVYLKAWLVFVLVT